MVSLLTTEERVNHESGGCKATQIQQITIPKSEFAGNCKLNGDINEITGTLLFNISL